MQNLYKKLIQIKPEWCNRQLLLILMTLMVFSLSVAWDQPSGKVYAGQNHDSQVKSEYAAFQEVCQDFQKGVAEINQFKNFDQTNRVLFGGIFVILMIVSMTLYGSSSQR